LSRHVDILESFLVELYTGLVLSVDNNDNLAYIDLIMARNTGNTIDTKRPSRMTTRANILQVDYSNYL